MAAIRKLPRPSAVARNDAKEPEPAASKSTKTFRRGDGRAKLGPYKADESGLNPQQRRFVTIFHSQAEKDGAAAVIEAGYSPNGAHAVASRLLKHVKVKEALAKLEKAEADAALITKASVMADIARQKAGAEEDGQWGAALRASELQGKALRLFDDPKAISIQEAVAMLERVISRLVPLIADDRREEASGLVQSVLGEMESA